MAKFEQSEKWKQKVKNFNCYFDYEKSSLAEFQERIIEIRKHFMSAGDVFLPPRVLIKMLGFRVYQNWVRDILAEKVKDKEQKRACVDYILAMDEQKIAHNLLNNQDNPGWCIFQKMYYSGAYNLPPREELEDKKEDGNQFILQIKSKDA